MGLSVLGKGSKSRILPTTIQFGQFHRNKRVFFLQTVIPGAHRGQFFGRAKLPKRVTIRLRGTAAQIATDSSPVSAVLFRARVAVPVQVAATPMRARA